MPAPKNNQFYKKRSKHGRDAIFTDAKVLLAAAYEYFAWNAAHPWYKKEAIKSGEKAGQIIDVPTERPLTIEGLTRFLGVNKLYFSEFEKGRSKDTKDFSEVITHIREVIYSQKYEGAVVGVFNANIISRDLGLIDKSAIDIDFNKMSETDIDKIINRLTNNHASQ